MQMFTVKFVLTGGTHDVQTALDQKYAERACNIVNDPSNQDRRSDFIHAYVAKVPFVAKAGA